MLPHWRLFVLLALLILTSPFCPSARAEIPSRIAAADLVTGAPVSMDLRSTSPKGQVVIFLSAKCPCSRSHEPKLAALAREFAPRGFEFVAVHSNTDEGEAESRQHFIEAKLPFPVAQDRGAALANSFGALKTPHAYIIKNGEILYQGGVDSSAVADEAKEYYLRQAMLAIESGKKPEPGITRCLGCMIKRN